MVHARNDAFGDEFEIFDEDDCIFENVLNSVYVGDDGTGTKEGSQWDTDTAPQTNGEGLVSVERVCLTTEPRVAKLTAQETLFAAGRQEEEACQERLKAKQDRTRVNREVNREATAEEAEAVKTVEDRANKSAKRSKKNMGGGGEAGGGGSGTGAEGVRTVQDRANKSAKRSKKNMGGGGGAGVGGGAGGGGSETGAEGARKKEKRKTEPAAQQPETPSLSATAVAAAGQSEDLDDNYMSWMTPDSDQENY